MNSSAARFESLRNSFEKRESQLTYALEHCAAAMTPMNPGKP